MIRFMGLKSRPWLLYPALLGLGAGALASCAWEESKPPQAAAVHPLPPTQAQPRIAPRPARKPTSPAPTGDSPRATGGESLAMTEPKPSAAPPVSEPAAPSSDAAGSVAAGKPAGSLPSHVELIGLDQPAATRLLGPATERSEEPPATVWRYKSGSCELDLFFYLDLRSGRMRTLHYALRDGAGDAAQRQNCLQSLIASRGN